MKEVMACGSIRSSAIVETNLSSAHGDLQTTLPRCLLKQLDQRGCGIAVLNIWAIKKFFHTAEYKYRYCTFIHTLSSAFSFLLLLGVDGSRFQP